MIYRFKATIEGNKIFMREYEVKGDSSLYALHIFLLNDLGFAPDQIVLFKARYKEDKKVREFGLFDLGGGTMDSIKIRELYSQELSALEYVYDTFRERALSLELLGIEEASLRESYPRLVAEKGKNPDQFSDSWDDFEQLINFSEEDPLSLSASDLEEE